MSCALVTAVTLTAVQRFGQQVSDSTPRLVSPAGVSAQVSQNSASAAAALQSARVPPIASDSAVPATSVSPSASPDPSVSHPLDHTAGQDDRAGRAEHAPDGIVTTPACVGERQSQYTAVQFAIGIRFSHRAAIGDRIGTATADGDRFNVAIALSDGYLLRAPHRRPRA